MGVHTDLSVWLFLCPAAPRGGGKPPFLGRTGLSAAQLCSPTELLGSWEFWGQGRNNQWCVVLESLEGRLVTFQFPALAKGASPEGL